MTDHQIRLYSYIDPGKQSPGDWMAMKETREPNERLQGAGTYEFSVRGHLPDKWEAWFEGMVLCRCDDGTTVLRGEIADQSSLHSVLLKIRNLNLALISVHRVDEMKGDTK